MIGFFRLRNLCLGSINEFGKRSHIGNSQIGKDLSVYFNAGLMQSIHQLAIGHAVHAGSRVNPGDPETTEIAFASPAVMPCIPESLHYSFICLAILASTSAPVSGGQFQYFFMACVSSYAFFNSWALENPPFNFCVLCVGKHFSDSFMIRLAD